MHRKVPFWVPDQPLPKYADRKTLAAIVTHKLFPVSPRTIERWPLVAKRPNKSVVYLVEEALRYAESQLENAYSYMQSGDRK